MARNRGGEPDSDCGVADPGPDVLQWALQPAMAQDDVLLRLARQIDAAKKTERFLVNADEVVSLRRQGASDLHRICAEFAAAVNSKLSEAALDLSPATYAP